MAGKRISRRKLASFVADTISHGAPADEVINQTAAYLIEARQTHDVELLGRDIEEALMVNGIVIADVTAARPLTSESTSAIAALLGAKQLHVRETADASIIGGILVKVSGKRYDATLRHKLNVLKSTE